MSSGIGVVTGDAGLGSSKERAGGNSPLMNNENWRDNATERPGSTHGCDGGSARAVLALCGEGFEARYADSFEGQEMDLWGLRLCSEADLRDELGVAPEDLPRLLSVIRGGFGSDGVVEGTLPAADGRRDDLGTGSAPCMVDGNSPSQASESAELLFPDETARQSPAMSTPSTCEHQSGEAKAGKLLPPLQTSQPKVNAFQVLMGAGAKRPRSSGCPSATPAAAPAAISNPFSLMMAAAGAAVTSIAGRRRGSSAVRVPEKQPSTLIRQAKRGKSNSESGGGGGGRLWGARSGPNTRPPPWKAVPGTDFIVDGFHHSGSWSKHYFLSHFHADHYTGLDPSFCAGRIYCTPETARLVALHLRVPTSVLEPLEVNKTHRIDGKAVSLVEANHCPGAVLFVFQVGLCTQVHCGDMRFEPSLLTAPFPSGLAGLPRISRLFLDTTYADPAYDFPTQAAILSAIDGIVRREESLGKAAGLPTVYLCGAYTIGKEKVWMRVWRSLGSNGEIYADSRRKRTLECLDLGRVFAALGSEHCSPRMVDGSPPTSCGLRRTSAAVRVVSTENSSSARVRVVSMSSLQPESRLKETLAELRASCGFGRLVAFRPTGWSFKSERGPGAGQRMLAAPDESQALVEGVGGTVKSLEGGRIKIFSVPYSEHSSVAELRRMVKALRPEEVIPTVAKSNQHRTQILDYLQAS